MSCPICRQPCSTPDLCTNCGSLEGLEVEDLPSAISEAVPNTAGRVIFLDIDGVLNTVDSRPEWIEPCLLHRFLQIIARTNAKVVISSSWRLHDRLVSKLKQVECISALQSDPLLYPSQNCTSDDCLVNVVSGQQVEIVGATPELSLGANQISHAACRCYEIRAWLGNRETLPASWIALDDLPLEETDASFFADHHVKVDAMVGLSEMEVSKAITLLSVEP